MSERRRRGQRGGAADEAEIDDAPLHLISPSQGQLQQGWPPEVHNIQLHSNRIGNDTNATPKL